MSAEDRPAARTGVVLGGPWTWQGRPVEDVVSSVLMEADSIARLARQRVEEAEGRAAGSHRVAREMARTGEQVAAALQVIRARQRSLGEAGA